MKQKDKTAQQRGTPQITKINLIAQSIRNTTKVEQRVMVISGVWGI